MKKLLALILAFAMVSTLAACTGNPAPTSDPAVETKPTVEAYASYDFTQYGKARIDILGAEFIKDDYDEDVLRIYYNYTNTGDSACARYPGRTLYFKSITQDGNDIHVDYFGVLDECAIPEDLNYDNGVQPGLTSRQTMLLPCDPEGGPIEVSCYIMVGSWVYEADKVECLTFQIDPKNLPEVPEPLEMAPILEPTYAAGLPTSGTNDNGDISIDGFELTKGDEGEDVLRVKLTVTNNGDEATMPVNITDGVEVYQDGLGLPWFSTWDLEATEADEAYEVDLEPGQTVQCNALFELRNDHPVEIVVESLDNDLRLGMICDIEEAFQAQKDAEQVASDAATAEEAAARKALVGTWLQRDSDWEDTYIFNADGSGMLISGPEYPFTYSVSGDKLTLDYGDDDEEEFTFSVEGDLLTMVDMWDEQLLLDKQTAEAPETTVPETEPAETTAPAELTLKELIIGTWVSPSDGETYAFNADGTGYQIYEGVTYKYTYTIDDDYVDIFYVDYEPDGFYIEIDDDTLIIAGYYTYTRQ
jgi:hypothetical protein